MLRRLVDPDTRSNASSGLGIEKPGKAGHGADVDGLPGFPVEIDTVRRDALGATGKSDAAINKYRKVNRNVASFDAFLQIRAGLRSDN